MQPLFNKQLRPDCNIYLPTETPIDGFIPRQCGACFKSNCVASDRAVEDRGSSVNNKGRLVKFEPQTIDRLQNSRSTQQLLFQTTLTGKVKEHDSQQNRQQSLARHSWNRQQNTNRDQQDPKRVFADNFRSVKSRMTS